MNDMLDEGLQIKLWIKRLTHYQHYEVTLEGSYGHPLLLGKFSTLEAAQESVKDTIHTKIHYHIEPRRHV